MFRRKSSPRSNYIILASPWSILLPDQTIQKHYATDGETKKTLLQTLLYASIAGETAYDRIVPASTLSDRPTPQFTYHYSPDTTVSGNAFHYGETLHYCLKGSVEAVLAMCDLTEGEREKAMLAARNFATSGYDCLALAIYDDTQEYSQLPQLTSRPFKLIGIVAITQIVDPRAIRVLQKISQRGLDYTLVSQRSEPSLYGIAQQIEMSLPRKRIIPASEYHAEHAAQYIACANHAEVISLTNTLQQRPSTVVLSPDQLEPIACLWGVH